MNAQGRGRLEGWRRGSVCAFQQKSPSLDSLRSVKNSRADAMKISRRQFFRLGAGVALPTFSRRAQAQALLYPDKPVRIITHLGLDEGQEPARP
jgi:hypothetical protein